MRRLFCTLLSCALAVTAARAPAQSEPGAMPSPPPPKGPPSSTLPKTNPNKAPAPAPGGPIRKAVRVPAAPVTPLPTGKAGGDALLQMAFASYEAGNNALALQQIDAAEKLKPNVADAWNLRGAVLLRQGDYAKAEVSFRRAVNLDPNLWAAKFNLAEIPFRRKDFAVARKNFDDLSTQTDRYKLEIEWELLQYKLVVCSLLMNDESAAQRRFGRLKPGGASPAYFYSQAAFAFAKKDATAANKFLSFADSSSKPGMRSIFSDTLVRAGWIAGAAPTQNYDPTQGQTSGPRTRGLPVPQLPPALDLELPTGSGGIVSPDAPPPKSEPPLPGSGEAGEPAPAPAPSAPPKAAPSPEPSLKPPPLATPAPAKVSEARLPLPGWISVRRTGLAPASGAGFLRIANQPDAYGIKLREAQAKLRTKDFDAASKLLEEAIELTDNPAEVHNLRGAIEYYRGDYAKAESLFQLALKSDPASWPARFNLAEIAFARKNYPAARELYETMLPDTDTLKQPIEREMLQFKVFLTLLQDGKVELAQRMSERLPLAGQTPARYYCQVALESTAKRYEKAAEVLNSAEQFYAASLNFLFAQPLEKLGLLPLPNTAPAATAVAPTPAPAAPAQASPPPAGTPRSPDQLIDEIVTGQSAPAAPPAAKAKSDPGPISPPRPVPISPTTAVAAATPAASVAPVPVRTAEASSGWLADLVRSLFPGSDPTRLELVLFALGVLNLLGMVWLMGHEIFTRFIRPRTLSLHTAGSVGVAVNKVRNIERLRIRFSIANMTSRAQTVGQLDALMTGANDWKRTFHWRKLCLNPSGNSAAFEEMDVYPLVLLPGEVASLYVDFVADGSDAPAQWMKGNFRIEVLGWTEAHAGRARPDFKVSFPLEVPSIPWRNQELLVDLAIDRSAKDGSPRVRERFLDAEEIAARNAAQADPADDAKYAPPPPPEAPKPAPAPARSPRRAAEAGPELPLFENATPMPGEPPAPVNEPPAAAVPEPAAPGIETAPVRSEPLLRSPGNQTPKAPPARPLPPISTHPAAGGPARAPGRPPGTTLVPLPPRDSETRSAAAPPPPARNLAGAVVGPRARK